MAKPGPIPSKSPIKTEYTLTYSSANQGFPSFYSYYPEQIQGMNQDLYTFKNGNLFIHNSNTEDRCTFYGEFTPAKLWGVFNIAPEQTKVFKTIELDSNSEWGLRAATDIESGDIDSEYFELKEGNYFSFIRGEDNVPVSEPELALRSSQGIGSCIDVDIVDPSAIVITYKYNVISSMLSIGDLLYFLNGGVYTFCGVVTAISLKVISGGVKISKIIVDSTGPLGGSDSITVGDYTFSIKNGVAESHGLRGYYMDFIIENYNTERSEIFSIISDMFKSYP